MVGVCHNKYDMKQQIYIVGDKQYSREQLIAFGKEHDPRLYWITRIIGIFLMSGALFLAFLVGIAMLILYVIGVFKDPSFPIWVFYIPLGLFASIFLAGMICFILSFVNKNEERYIKYALSYLTNHHITLDDKESCLSTRDLQALERYERLLKGGVISQEEYEQKRKELLG